MQTIISNLWREKYVRNFYLINYSNGIIISIDMNRVSSFREPIFAIVKQEDDSSMKTIIYQGLGYEVRMIKDVTTDKTIQVEMYMFNKCIVGAIE